MTLAAHGLQVREPVFLSDVIPETLTDGFCLARNKYSPSAKKNFAWRENLFCEGEKRIREGEIIFCEGEFAK